MKNQTIMVTSESEQHKITKGKGYIEINFEGFEECYLCIARNLIEVSNQLNFAGFYPAMPTNTNERTTCGLYWQVCPDNAITVFN